MKADSEIISKICDICKKEYKEEFEMQDFIHIDFEAGYGPEAEDGTTVECDICVKCLKDKLGPYLRINNYEINC